MKPAVQQMGGLIAIYLLHISEILNSLFLF